jgi:NADPH:quinone reductase-like Zn-dependent oxidoreductase
MKALTLVASGGIEQLRVQELPAPIIKAPTDVLLRVHATALNRLDLFVTGGLPGSSLSFPHVMGSDGAGVVLDAGSAAQRWRAGDRVMINPTLSCGECRACLEGQESLCGHLRVIGEHSSGTTAEYVVVPAQNLAPVPPDMPWPQAAAFSLATLTAWHMLETRAELRPGETVLIWGIGGGVAMAALQIARLIGARTVVTSGSDKKLAMAQSMGAEVVLNHRTTDIRGAIREYTGGRGADVVVDSAGEQSWPVSLRALRRGGRLVVCGATTGPAVSLDLRRLFWHQWSILGATLGSQKEYAEIVLHAAEGRLWPVIDRTVPLQDAPAAYERLATGEQFGKLVIEVTQ